MTFLFCTSLYRTVPTYWFVEGIVVLFNYTTHLMHCKSRRSLQKIHNLLTLLFPFSLRLDNQWDTYYNRNVVTTITTTTMRLPTTEGSGGGGGDFKLNMWYKKFKLFKRCLPFLKSMQECKTTMSKILCHVFYIAVFNNMVISIFIWMGSLKFLHLSISHKQMRRQRIIN